MPIVVPVIAVTVFAGIFLNQYLWQMQGHWSRGHPALGWWLWGKAAPALPWSGPSNSPPWQWHFADVKERAWVNALWRKELAVSAKPIIAPWALRAEGCVSAHNFSSSSFGVSESVHSAWVLWILQSHGCALPFAEGAESYVPDFVAAINLSAIRDA